MNLENMQKISCLEAYNIISSLICESKITCSVFKNGLKSLQNAGSEYNVYMYEMDVKSINSDILKQVIGKDGCYFIKTTQQCDLDFLWHNRNTQKIEFWGPKDNIYKAINAIKYRIFKKTNNTTNTTITN